MMEKEEISSFKQKHVAMEKKIEKIGTKQFPAIVKLSRVLKELMDGIEGIQEQEKKLHDPHVSKRIRIMKKGIKLGKNIKYFDDNIIVEFDQGSISEETGKKFVSITKLIKKNKMLLAKKEFEYFQDLLELNKKYEQSEEKLEDEEQMLKREEHRINKILADMLWLESQAINLEKARKYEEILGNLEKLEQIRATYLLSLSLEPISDLLENEYVVTAQFNTSTEKEKIGEIQHFFSEYPALGKYTVGQICELFNASEKRISHICPETSKFKRTIVGNKNLFETLHKLKQTNFLAVNAENGEVMAFYAQKIKGAREIVEQIKSSSKEKLSCKKEYEKKNRMEAKKKELSKYSKEELEAELREIESSLELLHLRAKDPQPGKKQEKDESFFAKITSFFKS